MNAYPRHRLPLALLALTGLGAASFAIGAPSRGEEVVLGPQTDDVWVYTFGQGAFATAAPSFAGIFEDNDPDRLGYFFLTFDAAGVVEPGGRPKRIASLTLSLSMLNSSSFDQTNGVIYDDSYDPVETYLTPGLDADPGRPIELYAVGFQNGFTLEAWRQANFPVTGPGGYNAVPIDFPGESMTGRDVSYSVSSGFETEPIAIGTTDDLLIAGDGTQRVQDLARWTFAVADFGPGLDAHLQQSLENGAVSFIVSSLQLAGFDGMGGDEVYPRFATLETLFPVDDAALGLVIETSLVEDVNTDFAVDIEDLYAWEQGEGLRDINEDGATNATDRQILLSSLRAGEIADMLP